MTPEQVPRVRRLFEEALEIDPEQRSTWLSERADGTLRAEVESLLRGHASGTNFLNRVRGSLAAAAAPESAEELTGRRVGPYELLDPIGQGGMGTVYRAARADDAFRKIVAVKLLGFQCAGPEMELAFRMERQILASLEHPDIARLIDGGATPEGLLYIVMELVDGQPIDRFCEENALSLDRRLTLFESVCSAVEHAHRNLVVHRDLKPSNILVTAEGRVKLLDFGIAKVLGGAPSSAAAGGITTLPRMTPLYASPEQIQQRPITTATDVYSLGVVLYGLLTGGIHPYKSSSRSLSDTLSAICEGDPPWPSATAKSSFRRQLRGDLDNIVRKAMARDPNARYSSVAQLAEDLRRHRAGLQVMARSDTWKYRAQSLVRRHKIETVAASMLALSLSGGIVVSRREAARAEVQRLMAESQRAAAQQSQLAAEEQRHAAEDQRQIAETERRRAEDQTKATDEQRTRAERRFGQVRQLAHRFLFDFDRAIQTLQGATSARQLLVKTALEYLDSLAREARGDAGLLRELATSYEKVGDVQGNPYLPNVGDPAGAFESYLRAISIRRSMPNETPEARRDLVMALLKIGDLHAHLGKTQEGLTATRQALDLANGTIRDYPENRIALDALMRVHSRYGDLLDRQNTAAALDQYRQSTSRVRDLERIGGPTPETQKYLATTLRKVSQMLRRSGDEAGSLLHARESLTIAQKLAEAEPLNAAFQRELMASHLHAGDVFNFSRNPRPSDALPHYREALAITERAAETDRANVQARSDLILVGSRLGDVFLALKEYKSALDAFAKTLRMQETLVAENPKAVGPRDRFANFLLRMAPAQLGAGDRSGAIASLRRALATLEELARIDPATRRFRWWQYTAYRDLGRIQLEQQDWPAAIASFENALVVGEEWTATDSASASARHSVAEAHVYVARASSGRAAAEPRSARLLWERARERWLKVRTTWQPIATAGQLASDETGLLDEAAREIARCETILLADRL